MQSNFIWKNKKSTKDPFGRTMNKNNVELEHIVLSSKGGNDNYSNLQLLYKKSNREKSDKLSGNIDGKTFKVNRSTKNKNQGKMSVKK